MATTIERPDAMRIASKALTRARRQTIETRLEEITRRLRTLGSLDISMSCGGDGENTNADAAMAHEQADEIARSRDRLRREELALRAALERIDAGEYGVCRECGEAIAERRLLALPAADTCVGCQSEQERQATGKRPRVWAPDREDVAPVWSEETTEEGIVEDEARRLEGRA